MLLEDSELFNAFIGLVSEPDAHEIDRRRPVGISPRLSALGEVLEREHGAFAAPDHPDLGEIRLRLDFFVALFRDNIRLGVVRLFAVLIEQLVDLLGGQPLAPE